MEVITEYHNTPHSGYGGQKPIDIYMNGEKSRYEIPTWSVLSILKMETEERSVSTQGIKYNNGLYWHQELRHLSKQKVMIKYNSENPDIIMVIHKGKFVCAATIKETMKMVREDEDRVAQHVASQKIQEREVKEAIAKLTGKPMPKLRKASSSNMLTGEVIDIDTGNVTVLEHEKAMKEYKKEIAKKQQKAKPEEGAVDRRFRTTGEEVLKRVMNR